MNCASIYQHSMQDHNRLRELFRQFQMLRSNDRAKAVQLFESFKTGLEHHIAWEEDVLFPAFESQFVHLGWPTQALRREHLEIREFLNAIAEKLRDENCETDVEELGLEAVLRPHTDKEESILYRMVDQVSGGEERSEILARMIAGT